MTQASMDTVAEVAAKDIWSLETYQELISQLFETTDSIRKFREIVADIEAQNPSPSGASALKVGIARYILCRYDQAIEALDAATDNKDRFYFLGQCYRAMRKYDQAREAFDRAKAKGWGDDIDVLIVECLAMAGQIDQANVAMNKLQRVLGESDDIFYLTGLLQEITGQCEEAIKSYDQARNNRIHPEATFRLAYLLDLHGEEEEALELYEECLAQPPVYANALLNMAVLYEDKGQYDQATKCLQKLLASCPNHSRARLFLKDTQASTGMYYDEDQAKIIAKRNAVLDIPVTDFELSVRARNCLKKMNIRSLGDLVRTSEPDLLGYKNFGETSLKEIKEMLTAKGLRLGQYAEDGEAFHLLDDDEDLDFDEPDEETRAKPLAQIEFSVRAKRVLEQLDVSTIGELADKTEAELMEIKNFGQTSMSEMRQKLAEFGLDFKEE